MNDEGKKMFVPETMYTIYCDEPDCAARVPSPNEDDDRDLLASTPDLTGIRHLLISYDGTPWIRGPRGRLMCPEHSHIIEHELDIAATHDPLF